MKNQAVAFLVSPPGIEPGPKEPESLILSIRLQAHCRMALQR